MAPTHGIVAAPDVLLSQEAYSLVRELRRTRRPLDDLYIVLMPIHCRNALACRLFSRVHMLEDGACRVPGYQRGDAAMAVVRACKP